jgi:simple sugar transport system substrate-binding protein
MALNRRGLVPLLGAAALAAPAILRYARADAPVKIGFVYVGPIGDFGWTYQHDIGRKQAQAAFGGRIVTDYVENVSELPSSEAVFESLAASGHKLIFGTSLGYGPYMLKVAARYPHVKFEHCTGDKRRRNLATYNIRFYQGRYVQGVIAGKLSKSGIAGYVATLPVPEVVQGINAFLLGMRSVNPQSRVKYVMIGSWYDLDKEAAATKSLIAQGADIITQHTDSPEPLGVAAGLGIPAFGEATDMISFAPHDQLTASVNDWGGYYTQRIAALLKGDWTATDTWGGFADGMLQMAPYRNMPAAVATLATQTVTGIAAGRTRIFIGPLTDVNGTIILPPGHTMDDATLVRLKSFLQGTEDISSARPA